MHERRRGRIWRELDAEGALGERRVDANKDVGHKGAAHLQAAVLEHEGDRLEQGVHREAGVVKHCVNCSVLTAKVGLAAVRKVKVRVTGDTARLEGWRGGR